LEVSPVDANRQPRNIIINAFQNKASFSSAKRVQDFLPHLKPLRNVLAYAALLVCCLPRYLNKPAALHLQDVPPQELVFDGASLSAKGMLRCNPSKRYGQVGRPSS
jgi:hypothetical protein